MHKISWSDCENLADLFHINYAVEWLQFMRLMCAHKKEQQMWNIHDEWIKINVEKLRN